MQILRATRKSRDPQETLAEANQIARVIAAATRPSAIYLFGSVAEGKPTDQSDFDFIVVMPTEESIRDGQKNLRSFRPLSKCAVDLIWMSEEDFKQKSGIGGVALIAKEDGQLLYLGQENND